MTTIYFLHVLFAFAAIAFLVVPGLMLEMAARTRDVPFIRRAFQLGKFHGQIGGPLALLRIGTLAQASPEAAPSAELAAAIDDPMSGPLNGVSGLLWIFLIWLMVSKPF